MRSIGHERVSESLDAYICEAMSTKKGAIAGEKERERDEKPCKPLSE